MTFQHDGASIHMSRKAMAWYADHQIQAKYKPERITADDWENLETIHSILESFYAATKTTEGSQTLLHTWFMTLQWLIHEIDAWRQELNDEYMVACLTASWNKIKKYYILADQTPIYYAAVMLNPTLKMQWFRQVWDTDEKAPWILFVQEKVKAIWLSEYKNTPSSSSLPSSKQGKDAYYQAVEDALASRPIRNPDATIPYNHYHYKNLSIDLGAFKCRHCEFVTPGYKPAKNHLNHAHQKRAQRKNPDIISNIPLSVVTGLWGATPRRPAASKEDAFERLGFAKRLKMSDASSARIDPWDEYGTVKTPATSPGARAPAACPPPPTPQPRPPSARPFTHPLHPSPPLAPIPSTRPAASPPHPSPPPPPPPRPTPKPRPCPPAARRAHLRRLRRGR